MKYQTCPANVLPNGGVPDPVVGGRPHGGCTALPAATVEILRAYSGRGRLQGD